MNKHIRNAILVATLACLFVLHIVATHRDLNFGPIHEDGNGYIFNNDPLNAIIVTAVLLLGAGVLWLLLKSITDSWKKATIAAIILAPLLYVVSMVISFNVYSLW